MDKDCSNNDKTNGDDDQKLLSTVPGQVDGAEDENQMEQLALSTDFDPAFLDCWEDEAAAAAAAAATASSASSSHNNSNMNDAMPLPQGASSTMASTLPPSMHHPLHRSTTDMNTGAVTNNPADGAPLGLTTPEEQADATWDEFDKAHQALLGGSTATTTTAGGLTGYNSGRNSTVAVPSSHSDGTTTLPPFETTATGTQAAAAAVVMGLLQQQQQQQPVPTAPGIPILPQPEPQVFQQQPPGEITQSDQHVQDPLLYSRNPTASNNVNAASLMDSSALLPLAFNALQAGVDLSSFFNASGISVGDATGNAVGAAVPAPATVSSNATSIASATPPPLPHSVATSDSAGTSLVSAAVQMPMQAPLQGTNPSMLVPPIGGAIPVSNETLPKAPGKKKAAGSKKKPPGGGRRKTKGQAGSKKQAASAAAKNSIDEEEAPPFMLFDAPVELRTNFNISQMEQGLPEIHDNNSYHYAKSSSSTASKAAAKGSGNTAVAANQGAKAGMPKLADARHGDDLGSKRIKNAKEQKRAQRITELIEQLRFRMERGGWKVGIKSKLQTLSSCSGYLKHLVKVTKEKEELVEKAKGELEAKRRKLELEKSAQDPSEPESTTSSLTVSSGSRSAHHHKTSSIQPHPQGNGDTSGNNSSHEQASDPSAAASAAAGADPGGSGHDPASEESEGSPDKKRKLSSHESNSEEYSSSVDNDESGGKKARSGQVGQVSIGPVSSVSDITDNNKYNSKSSSSSDDTTGTMTGAPQGDGKKASTPQPDPSAQNTVCSDAAVAEASGPKDSSHDGSSGKADEDNNKVGMSIQTITTTTRKRKLQELTRVRSEKSATSLEANFRLDYEEVFLKSNVPQIISSTTGRIVAFNEIFLRATALRRSQVDRLTIFSLVQTSMLSNLFELVASSLRQDDEQERPKHNATTPLQDYSTMTLPCVPFHVGRPHLYMTITLMSDENIQKRCFHCIFTDSEPAVKGAVGNVTPQLLATLFHPVDDGAADNQSKKGPKRGAEGSTENSSAPDSKPAPPFSGEGSAK